MRICAINILPEKHFIVFSLLSLVLQHTFCFNDFACRAGIWGWKNLEIVKYIYTIYNLGLTPADNVLCESL